MRIRNTLRDCWAPGSGEEEKEKERGEGREERGERRGERGEGRGERGGRRGEGTEKQKRRRRCKRDLLSVKSTYQRGPCHCCRSCHCTYEVTDLGAPCVSTSGPGRNYITSAA